MKFKVPVFLFALCITRVTEICCYCHDTPVHEAISEKAAEASPDFAAFLADQFGPANAPFLTAPKLFFGAHEDNIYTDVDGPVGWLKSGSRTEDNPFRYFNHFYDPTKSPARGLNDLKSGDPSFSWGALKGGKNDETWQNARDYQWEGLRSPNKNFREAYLAHMFYALGKVVHLNQDLSQPDHTRNDQHAWGKAIEPHGLANYEKKPGWFTLPPSSQQGWPYWRDAGFTKLEAFWDRNLYAGSSAQMKQALNDDKDSKPGQQLGLAEFSNGNFLGEDARYNEETRFGKHFFPFPSVFSGTTFSQIVQNLTAYTGTDQVVYRDGTIGTHVYLRKNADGVSVPHHSRLTFLGAHLTANGKSYVVADQGTTIADPLVLDDYHATLIPKAIKYSAGILDYFFRGQLETTVTCAGNGTYTLHIQNKSGQDLNGGSFRLFYDDTAGTRTELTGQNFTPPASIAVPDNGSVDAVFKRQANVASYILVYQGTIGGTGIDPVDQGIAVAAKRFTVPCETIPIADLVWTVVNQPGAGLGPNSSWSMAGGDGTYSLHGFDPNVFLDPGDWFTIQADFCNGCDTYDATIEIDYTIQDDPRGGSNAGQVQIYFDSWSNIEFSTDSSGTLSMPVTITPGSHWIALTVDCGEIYKPFPQVGCNPGSNVGTFRIRPLNPP